MLPGLIRQRQSVIESSKHYCFSWSKLCLQPYLAKLRCMTFVIIRISSLHESNVYSLTSIQFGVRQNAMKRISKHVATNVSSIYRKYVNRLITSCLSRFQSVIQCRNVACRSHISEFDLLQQVMFQANTWMKDTKHLIQTMTGWNPQWAQVRSITSAETVVI